VHFSTLFPPRLYESCHDLSCDWKPGHLVKVTIGGVECPVSWGPGYNQGCGLLTCIYLVDSPPTSSCSL
jgi:hypothetical protein